MKLFYIVAVVAFSSGTAWSESAHSLCPSVAKIVQPMVKGRKISGAVVGIITPNSHEVCGFGKERDDSKKVPDGDTIYMIGSVQKLFTGAILAQMTLDKSVRLDQPIKELMPANRKVRENGRGITLVDLATHSSGLPANAKNPPKVKGGAISDSIQIQWTFDELNNLRPHYAPGAHFEYSNFGAVLLQDLLALKAKESFSTLTQKGIFEPLQMTSTFSKPPQEAFARIAQGHDGNNKPFVIQTSENYQKTPVAQFYSTANDMIKYLEAHMGEGESTIQKALNLTQVEYFKINKRKGMGLFWHIKDGHEYSKNGHTGKSGFHSIVIFDRKKRQGVVILSNTANGKVDEIGRSVFQALPNSAKSEL